MNWREVTEGNKKVWINLDRTWRIAWAPEKGCTVVQFSGGRYVFALETPEQILAAPGVPT